MFYSPDMHMHSEYSDGTDNIAKLLDTVRKAQVDIFALTDHDEFKGCAEMRKLLSADDARFINGIEFTCADDSGKSHILGYRFSEEGSPVERIISHTRAQRKERLEERIEYLKNLGIVFTDEGIAWLKSRNNSGKAHLAQLMIKDGYAADRPAAFEILNARRENDGYITPEQAINAIRESGGIPVLAHGILGNGADRLTEEEITSRVERFKGYGLMGLECFYPVYTQEQKEIMLRLADKNHFLVTAGSDYHGMHKTARAGVTGCDDINRLREFYEAL